jgi:predicted dehydrogenase
MLDEYADSAELVALCDANRPALEARAAELPAEARPALYDADDFDLMVADSRPDGIVVLTPDDTHDEYICRALRLGCDCVTEKPLTTTPDGCRRILDACRQTGRHCRVAFNYRYAPWNSQIKRLLSAGVIGRVHTVTLRRTLPFHRGPSYFHRWHGESARSGGLLIHKGTHYLDLASFFLADVPRTVYAHGSQQIYTEEFARSLGLTARARRCGECGHADVCPFFRAAEDRPEAEEVVRARGEADGYWRDQCVFRPQADTPDTIDLTVRYAGGAVLSYTLLAFGDQDSSGIYFGTHGRMRITGDAIRVTPYYAEPYDVRPPRAEGGHGGADPVMFADLFGAEPLDDPLGRSADERDGAWAMLVGTAANESMATGRPVDVARQVGGMDRPDFAPNRDEPEGFQTADMRRWMDARGQW